MVDLITIQGNELGRLYGLENGTLNSGVHELNKYPTYRI